MSAEESNVRVAVRVRPMSSAELSSGCRECVHVSESAQTVSVGGERMFTFDHAFGPECSQATVYGVCVRPLVNAAANGYNATVLAYGQTGSGKTYTMGTSWESGDAQDEDHYEVNDDHSAPCEPSDGCEEECLQAARRGIIPRAIRELFANMRMNRYNEMNKGHEPPEFRVHAQFIELYNEELIDLLEPAGPLRGALKLTEDGSGGVHISGAARRAVSSAAAALAALREGALARSTAATRMNATSSRSHAVYTLLLHQRRRMYRDMHDDDTAEAEYETLSAKFHFVDLAGSERLKRTGATGDRAKEGISINCGLLALGNVISALGDKSRRAAHVPYRDSRLTRLLQDSLGGNSRTLMVACVSAVDADFVETLSTLKYANRARNIRNRCVLNQDVSSRTVRALREELARVRLELQEYRQGRRTAAGWSDAARENVMLAAELEAARARLAAAHAALDALTARHAALVAATDTADASDDADRQRCALTALVSGYVQEIERLRAELLSRTAEQEYRQKRAAVVRQHDNSDLIGDAKRELDKEKELLARSMGELELQRSLGGGDGPGLRERAEGESGGEGESDEDEYEDDEEAERKCAAMSAELAALSEDIDTKARLVEQLEDSERRMQELRRRYEAKLQEMQGRLRSPSTQHRAHGGQGTQHLVRLKEELARLRHERVQLVRRMRQEAAKHRQAHMAKSKEVAQLRKESRRNANLIRTLEADRNLKEQVLKRKQEEVSLLRRSQRSKAGRRSIGCDQQWDRLARWLNTAVAARSLTAELQQTLQHAATETRRGAKGREHLQYLQRTVKDTQQQLQLLGERDDLRDLRTLLAETDEAGARVAAERALRAALNAASNAAEQALQLRRVREELRHLQMRLLSDVDLAHVSSGTSTRPVSPEPAAEDAPPSPTTPPEPFQRNAVRRGSVRLRDLGVYPPSSPASPLMSRSLQEDGRPSPLTRVPSAPGSLRTPPSSTIGRPLLLKPHASGGGDSDEGTVRRRTREEDVFNRLAPETRRANGVQVAVRRMQHKRTGGDALRCTHVCEGHVGQVHALAAVEHIVCSTGIDRSVRAWDVRAGRQVWQGAGGGGAMCVTGRGVAVAAEGGVRLWDTRTGKAGELLAGEVRAVAAAGDHLYTVAGDKLRLWDLRTYSCAWTTHCGHAAAVTCVCVCQWGVVTGSRDHTVRVLRRAGGEVTRRTFNPPHYDGVQAACGTERGTVYSASRDGGVKRWSVSEEGVAAAGAVTAAHAGWVSGVAELSGPAESVVTCGRDGAVRVWGEWGAGGGRQVGGGKCNRAQVAVACAGAMIYSAGVDGVVRCWRYSISDNL